MEYNHISHLAYSVLRYGKSIVYHIHGEFGRLTTGNDSTDEKVDFTSFLHTG